MTLNQNINSEYLAEPRLCRLGRNPPVRNKVEEDGITMYSGAPWQQSGTKGDEHQILLRAAFARHGTTMFVGIGIPFRYWMKRWKTGVIGNLQE